MSRDFSTRPPRVVARSVLRNELLSVLEWHCPPERTKHGKRYIPNARPDQEKHVIRYAEKARALLAQDGIAEAWLDSLARGEFGDREVLLAAQDALNALANRLDRDHCIWAAGGEEAWERSRERGGPASRIASKKARISSAASVGPESRQTAPGEEKGREAAESGPGRPLALETA